ATASRDHCWDLAAQLHAEMFATTAATGSIETQLAYYRGHREFFATKFLTSSAAMAAAMSKVSCRAGPTHIGRTLAHARREDERQKVAALVVISDACEEVPHDLVMAATELGMPAFMFREGENASVKQTYSAIAGVTKGAWASFDSGSAQRL